MSPEAKGFTGKTALITGATGHLGSAIAKTLAESGCNLVLVDMENEKLLKLATGLAPGAGGSVATFACDFSDRESRLGVIKDVSKSITELDLLINNAAFVGTSELEGWSEPFESQSTKAWQTVFEVNLTSMFDFAQGLFENLQRAESPAIVNIASTHAHVGPDWSLYKGTRMSSPAAYSSSKSGVVGLTRWLATTMAPKVRVNSVSPGGIARGQDGLFVDRYADRIPLGRMATEADIVGPALFLAGHESKFITGQDLLVDGGYTIL
jgi:NAD(P)-dependent dehydrogenase (short-subunit alcohol dehydrogenase family)